MAKSPSVTLIEKDLSTYTVTSSETVLAVVGYATKGPIGVPTMVTSLKSFKKIFGYCSRIPYSYLAIINAFKQGNQVVFTRVAKIDGGDMALSSRRVINNTKDQINGYTEFTRSSDVPVGTAGFTNGKVYSFKVGTSGSEVPIYLSSPASGGWYMDNIYSQIESGFGVTRSFQEFSSGAVSINGSTIYGMNILVGGANIYSNSSNNQEIMLQLSSTDSLSNIATKINEAITSGTRGYTSWALDGEAGTITIGGDGHTGYKLFIKTVSTDSLFTEVYIPTPTSVDVNGAVSLINNALITQKIAARCYHVGGNLLFVSTAMGSSAFVGVNSIPESVVEGSENILRALVTEGSEITEPGQSGIVAGIVSAEQNPNTLKVRLTLGESKTGDVTLAINDTSINGTSLITLFGTVDAANLGRLAITGYTVSRSSATRKIRFTSNTTTAPSVVTGTVGSSLTTMLLVDDPETGEPAVTSDTSDKVIIDSLETGSSTSRISVVKSTTVNALTDEDIYTVEVYYDGELQETFGNISLTIADDNFIEKVINVSVEEGGSEWVKFDTVDTTGDGKVDFPDGTYNLGKANDGSTDVSYGDINNSIGSYDYMIGTDGIPSIGGEDLFVNALSTSGDLANDELYNFHILITPDNTSQIVQDAAIALAENRADFIYLVDPPMGYTYLQVKNWHNGKFVRTSAVTSSYAAVYWPWLKEYDSENKAYVWCPPSVFMAAKLLEVDRLYNPWYAPAGDTRGVLSVQDLEKSPSFNEREELYGGLNCVNPIVNFISKGVIVYGQKTALRNTSALDRVNVRRMTIYAKKLIKQAMNTMLFEPNNTDSWQSATNLINSILEPIRQDNGIEQYKVVIDSSINTADVMAQNIMKGIIKIVPTGTIEIIELNLNVYKTGTTIS